MKQQLLYKLVSCSQLQPYQFTDLCQQLKKSNEVLDAQGAQKLLDLFCHFCCIVVFENCCSLFEFVWNGF